MEGLINFLILIGGIIAAAGFVLCVEWVIERFAEWLANRGKG